MIRSAPTRLYRPVPALLDLEILRSLRSLRTTTALPLTLVGALSSACMLTPNNQQEVCGVDANVGFAGFTIGAGQTITIEVAPTSTGPWTVLTTATSGSTAFNVDGVDLYGWSTTAPIDVWEVGGPGFVAYARASLGVYDLITFDDPSVTGVPAGICIQNELASGLSLLDAVAVCDSSSSPVVELIAPFISTCPCAAGLSTTTDVVIETPADLADARCLETIDANLEVVTADFPVVDLHELTEVTGNVTLDYQWSGGTSTAAARLIEADVLATVGGNVELVWDDTAMINPVIDFELPALADIAGDLTIDIHNVNYNASGLPVLANVTGDLSLVGSSGDIYAMTMAPLLTDVGGGVLIEPGYALRHVFEGLQTVGGDFVISGGFIDTPVIGLDQLADVGGDMRFSGAEWAPVGEGFPALSSVGGNFELSSGATLSALSYITTATVDVGGVVIDQNPDLATLDADLVVGTSGPITITDNTSLDTCDAETFVDDQTALGWSGTATISGNVGPGC